MTPLRPHAREGLSDAEAALDHATPLPLTARRSGPLKGRVRVPGDKSISHRALIFGALAVGETRISGLLEGEDVLNTGQGDARARRRRSSAPARARGAFAASASAASRSPTRRSISAIPAPACRLVMGAVAGCPITATFDGDASLRKRPMRRVLDPLDRMGARPVAVSDGGRLPLTLQGARDPMPIVYRRRCRRRSSSRRCCSPGLPRPARPP